MALKGTPSQVPPLSKLLDDLLDGDSAAKAALQVVPDAWYIQVKKGDNTIINIIKIRPSSPECQ